MLFEQKKHYPQPVIEKFCEDNKYKAHRACTLTNSKYVIGKTFINILDGKNILFSFVMSGYSIKGERLFYYNG